MFENQAALHRILGRFAQIWPDSVRMMTGEYRLFV